MNPDNGIPYNNPSDADALEAYDSFRRSRCLFFCLLLAGLLTAQGSFWIVEAGCLDTVIRPDTAAAIPAENTPTPPDHPQTRLAESLDILIQTHLKISNYLTSFSVVLYCLSLLIALKLSLVSRLGGLAPASKAFFLSLIGMVLILPWQSLISPGMPGTLFTYEELIKRHSACANCEHFTEYIYYYGRFTGLWVITLSILIAAQIRSRQATRKIYQKRTAPHAAHPVPSAFSSAETSEKEIDRPF
jgi:hypothetical protein